MGIVGVDVSFIWGICCVIERDGYFRYFFCGVGYCSFIWIEGVVL